MSKAKSEFLEVCVDLADLYVDTFIQEHKRTSPNLDSDPWDSLEFFLEYAFEREGRAPDYRPVAISTIGEVKGQHLTGQSAKNIWRTFKRKLNNEGLNFANNPLCPSGEEYKRKGNNKKKYKVKGLSIVELICQELSGQCIVVWAKESLRSHRTKEAHDLLKRVNGIHNKIASLFLREVAIVYGIKVDSNEERVLLQPVDTWIRYVARVLADKPELSDQGCASFLVSKDSESEKANAGIWYFCTQIAESSKHQVKHSIENPDYMNTLISRHIDRLISRGKVATEFGKRA